ncbi:MAG: hypothetical protein J3K34DRAFT_526006 [Monoraphidium minutum]|nr:MAG: hypothetical protein J3K34DRAFT_526006 [Monoraphidium minutum]
MRVPAGNIGAGPTAAGRRALLLAAAAAAALAPQRAWAAAIEAVAAVGPVVVRPELAPDQRSYDASDPELRAAAGLLQEALNAPSVVREEELWTAVIDKYGGLQRPWVPDVVGRAYGNRGNARSRQGKLDAALADYNVAIGLCPWSVDPLLNRGVALEALGRFEEACADYRSVLAAAPDDPSAWNNLGNASAGLGLWSEAVEYFGKAAALAPSFSFASANQALAMYQVGQRDPAMRQMRSLLRRFPDFADVRAALAAALWAAGKEGEAETMWARVDDPRYRDVEWLSRQRRWPPSLVGAMDALLRLKSV